MWYRHKIHTITAAMESCIKGMENVLGYFENQVRYDGSLLALYPLPCGVLTQNIPCYKMKLQR